MIYSKNNIFLKQKNGFKKAVRHCCARSTTGFTLIEILIGFLLLVAVVIVASFFVQNILNLSPLFQSTFKTQGEVLQTLNFMTTELRSMSISAIGSYPIDTASSSVLTFYSDTDEDGIPERIRYFSDGSNLKKGILKPSGNPPVYNPANENVIIATHDIITTSSPIFSYYDENYSGSQPPMTYPIHITDIRTIKVIIVSQPTNNTPSQTYIIFATPRNLRSNL